MKYTALLHTFRFILERYLVCISVWHLRGGHVFSYRAVLLFFLQSFKKRLKPFLFSHSFPS